MNCGGSVGVFRGACERLYHIIIIIMVAVESRRGEAQSEPPEGVVVRDLYAKHHRTDLTQTVPL